MYIDDVMTAVGEFGQYQRLRYPIIGLASLFHSLQIMSMVFIAGKTTFYCSVPETNGSLSSDHIRNTSDFRSFEELVLSTGSSCEMYQYETALQIYKEELHNMSAAKQRISTLNKTACLNGYEFENNEHGMTLVSEFNLVCDKSALRSTAQSLYFAGKVFGIPLTGHLADKYGRRRMFLITIFLQAAFCLCAAVSSHIYMFYVFYCLSGSMDHYSIAFAMATEMVGKRYRPACGFGLHIIFSLGFPLIALLAYFIRHWRTLMLITLIPSIPLLVSFWALHEPLRWLLLKDRLGDAKDVLHNMSACNNRAVPDDVIQKVKRTMDKEMESTKKTRGTLLDLFRNWKISLITLDMWYCWLQAGLAFFAMSLITDNLGGSVYKNSLLIGIAEIAGFTSGLFVTNIMGRKKTTAASFFMTGSFSIASALSHDIAWLCIAFAMGAKFATCWSFGALFLLCVEVFPTEIRTLAVATSLTVSRIGSALCPFVLDLSSIWWPLPLLLIGGVSIVGGCLAILLPETQHDHLLQTIDQMMLQRKYSTKPTEPIEENAAHGEESLRLV